MADKRQDFYASVVGDCIRDPSARVLVVAAGDRDRQVFDRLGYKNVVFSNVVPSGSFAPFEFSIQDAESLSYADQSFDFAVIHEALHHCHSPHRALLELYRVAKHGFLAVEARDSWLMRLLQRLGVAASYEQEGIFLAGGQAGGVRGGPVPNFIYRWTEREVEKVIQSYAPHRRNAFRYFYGHDAPVALQYPGPAARKLALRCAYQCYRALAWAFPRQQNLFAFHVAPIGLQPWIELDDGAPRLSMTWARKKYRR